MGSARAIFRAGCAGRLGAPVEEQANVGDGQAGEEVDDEPALEVVQRDEPALRAAAGQRGSWRGRGRGRRPGFVQVGLHGVWASGSPRTDMLRLVALTSMVDKAAQ